MHIIKAMITDLFDFQSPGEIGDKRVVTSLLTEEEMVSSRLRRPKNVSFVTTRGGIPFQATMFPSPRPVSLTGTSTWVCPPSEEIMKRICRKLGEVNPRRDTHTTQTLDEKIHREILQHVTAL